MATATTKTKQLSPINYAMRPHRHQVNDWPYWRMLLMAKIGKYQKATKRLKTDKAVMENKSVCGYCIQGAMLDIARIGEWRDINAFLDDREPAPHWLYYVTDPLVVARHNEILYGTDKEYYVNEIEMSISIGSPAVAEFFGFRDHEAMGWLFNVNDDVDPATNIPYSTWDSVIGALQASKYLPVKLLDYKDRWEYSKTLSPIYTEADTLKYTEADKLKE